MDLFRKAFIKTLTEDMTSGGDSGVFGNDLGVFGGSFGNSDFYDKDGARLPMGGKFEPCDHCNQRTKCKKAGKCLKSSEKKHNGSITPLVPTLTRSGVVK